MKKRFSAQRVRLASLGMVGIIGAISSADAQYPINNSGLSPQECYQKDSGCTRFCGEVTGDMRYECFKICDRMLDNCLTTGDWDDSPLEVDPGDCRPRGNDSSALSSLLLQMVMVMGDENKDGRLPPEEVQLLKKRLSGQVNLSGERKKAVNPSQK